jgi:hypothetical protein
MRTDKKANVYEQMLIGFAIGAVVPVITYVVVEFVFELLMNAGIMADLGSGFAVTKRLRTLAVIAIAGNLIPFQILKSRRNYNTMRGILLATFIYAAIWIVYFWESIMI